MIFWQTIYLRKEATMPERLLPTVEQIVGKLEAIDKRLEDLEAHSWVKAILERLDLMDEKAISSGEAVQRTVENLRVRIDSLEQFLVK